MTRACRPLTAWRRLTLLVCAAASLVCAGMLLVPPRVDAQTCAGPVFGGSSTATVLQPPRAVTLGDFDRSGGLDAAVADATGAITVLLDDGMGGLVPQTPFGTVADPRDILAGDFDRDGTLDLAVASGGSSELALFQGDGAGGFTAQSPVALGVVPTRLATADFDRNGRADVVVVSETGDKVILLLGTGGFAFSRFSPDFDLTGPSAVAIGDFDRNGWLDLVVAQSAADSVQIYQGQDGSGGPPAPPSLGFMTGASVSVGTGPVDIAAGDVDRDGALDLVTADQGAGTSTILLGTGTGGFSFAEATPVGLLPLRVALLDFDRDGHLDLVVLNEEAGAPRVTVVPAQTTPPPPPLFDAASAVSLPLSTSATPVGLAVGDIVRDGRVDVAMALVEAGAHAVVVGPNDSGPDCLRSSFGGAPQAFAAGKGPVAVAVADLDEDGTDDLVVAASTAPGTIEVLRGSGGRYEPLLSLSGLSAPPRGVVAADFDGDGDLDVVAALGSGTTGEIQLFLGDGLGGLTPSTAFPTGLNASAVVAGDFDGNGAPDVAVTSQGSNQVQVFRGDGVGSFLPPTTIGLGGGAAPRSLARGDLDGNGTLDLVVAHSGGNAVTVLLGAGDGVTFTPAPGSPQTVGTGPWGVALGDFNGDTTLDLVTADHDALPVRTVTVLLGLGNGDFAPSGTFVVDAAPVAVLALDVTGEGDVDIAAVTGAQTLNLLVGDGAGGFATPATLFPVRKQPSAIVPVDADADGRLDLAIPCRDANSVVVLLGRPPGFGEAVRVAVGSRPTGVASADFDGDADLDLAVVNTLDDSVTVLTNDGMGVFSFHATITVGLAPQAIVATDLDLDGKVDLAVSNANAGTVSILSGDGAANFTVASSPSAGSTPDDLAVGDFDGDGAPDLAVCNKTSPGAVTVLFNDGRGGFTATTFPYALPLVGDSPTSIFVADFNRDGALDFATANDDSDNLIVRFGDGMGQFDPLPFPPVVLPLTAGDTSPVSVTGGDFEGDGDVDLAVVATASPAPDVLTVFENVAGTLSATPIRSAVTFQPLGLTAADLNRDGRVDLALAAGALQVLRGTSGLAFEPSEDVMAGREPSAAVVGDFDRDGRPDLALTNSSSDDVSILLSSACRARRLVVSNAPAACGTGSAPFGVSALVEARDEGGNPAACASGTVLASLVGAGATLGGDVDVDLDASGDALFDTLTVSAEGRRFRLRFDLSGAPSVPPAISRSFTLGQTIAIAGPDSVCPVSPASHSVDPGYDTYLWTTDGSPYAFAPTITLTSPPLTLDTAYTLAVQARIDGCVRTHSRSVYLGNLASVSVGVVGPVSFCVDCLGGTATATETGGGPVTGHQWGFRTAPAGAIIPIPGQATDTYVLNGLDFPGPGSYYLVETTTPTCGGAMVSNNVTVTVTASVSSGEVQSLGVTSRESGGMGQNVLQWVNTNGGLDEIRIRWNKAASPTTTCSPPTSPVSGLFDGEYVDSAPSPLAKALPFFHGGLDFDTDYCYAVFTRVSGVYSPGRVVIGRPFDTTAGPVRWSYTTGATAVVPPTVAFPGLIAMSNDRTIHSLQRGILEGLWPIPWMPQMLMGVAHSRSPVVPLVAPLNGADSVLFVGDDAGTVLAVNAETGVVVWGPVTPFNPLLGAMITGAPGGTFVQYGGPANVVVVGTRNNDPASTSRFVALNLADGSLADSYDGADGGGLGPVSGTPAVDNAGARVYFGSRSFMGTGDTLWCLSIDATPAFTYQWSLGPLEPLDFVGDIDGSLVLNNGRLYVASDLGGGNFAIHSVNVSNPSDRHMMMTGDGPVRGFLFPDRRNENLMFATNTKVWSVADGPTDFTVNWTWQPGGLEPSIVLFWPQTSFVYVGSKDGTLYQLDFSAGAPSATCDPYPGVGGSTCISLVLGDGKGHIGAPSLDIGVVPPDVSPGKKLLHVGSELGRLFAIEVPFP